MPVYKDEKKGTWYVVLRYTDWTGKKKQTTKRGFKTQRSAKNYERDFLVNKTEDLTMTFGEFYELYYTYISKRVKQNTLNTKNVIFEKKILPYFKDKRMCDIKASDIIKWQNIMMSQETKKKPKLFSRLFEDSS